MHGPIDGEYLPPRRFWSVVALILAVGAGLAAHEGWQFVEGWRMNAVAPFCKQCSALPEVIKAESPALYSATMGGHALLVLLGLGVLVIGVRMAFARITDKSGPPVPETEKDRQRRLDRMREEK